MNPKEKIIRDNLAENLEVIEPGLTLTAKELSITNPNGADGHIDIFAVDRFNHKVVIELKRSNEAARQAVHELLKYTELLRDQHGLTHSQIRVMLLSTDWNELLVPFSALTREVKFPCEGYRITVNEEGTIIEHTKIEPLKEAHLLDFIPHHMVYCFSESTDRDSAIPLLHQKLKQNGIEDFVFFSLNYGGQNERVFAPFMLYACMGTLPIERTREIFAFLGVTDEVQEYLEGTDEDEFEFFQRQVHEQVFATFSINCDDFGIGYPEKAGHLANEWGLASATRFGRWQNTEKVYSNAELWFQISAVGGKNVLVFKKETSPRFTASWNECKTRAENALSGYSPWKNLYGTYLLEIEKEHPTSAVGISIFDPVDLLFQLYSCVIKEDFGYVPHLEIRIDDPERFYKSITMSSWIWDGTTKPPAPKAFLAEMFEDPFDYIMYRHLGMLDHYYERILRIHGLSMPVLEMQEIGEKHSREFLLSAQNGKLIRTPLSPEAPLGKSLLEFCECNPDYMHSLVDFVQEYTIGLD